MKNWNGEPMPERISADYYGQNGSMGTYGLSGGACDYVRADIAEAQIAELQQALNEACSLLEIDTFRGEERVIGGSDIRASSVPAFAEYRRKW